jgi:hypothetical protein
MIAGQDAKAVAIHKVFQANHADGRVILFGRILLVDTVMHNHPAPTGVFVDFLGRKRGLGSVRNGRKTQNASHI